MGDSPAIVVAKCGSPTDVQRRTEIVAISGDYYDNQGQLRAGKKNIIEVEEWTYNFGTRDFLRYLTFKNGVLTDIRTGNYGY
jgi:hypothetical protein